MIYKEKQFSKFLELIEEGEQSFWAEIARAIGVDQDTITKWKETPEAQKAIAQGIINTLRQMEMAGKKDWRMWETKLRMLGVNSSQKIEAKVEFTDDRKDILEKYGLDVRKAEKAEGGSPEDPA